MVQSTIPKTKPITTSEPLATVKPKIHKGKQRGNPMYIINQTTRKNKQT
jgi:hypothetical protein